MDEANRRTAAATQRIVRRKKQERDWVMPPDGTPARLAAVDPLYIDVRHDQFAAAFVNSLQDLPSGSTFCGPQPSSATVSVIIIGCVREFASTSAPRDSVGHRS